MKFDREIRGSITAYMKLVDGGERYSYGLVKIAKKKKEKRPNGQEQKES